MLVLHRDRKVIPMGEWGSAHGVGLDLDLEGWVGEQRVPSLRPGSDFPLAAQA